MSDAVASVAGIPIRLTDERWAHVIDEHAELAGLRVEILKAIAEPQRVVEGRRGELLATREIGPGEFLVVVYRETGDDRFVITAFLTRRSGSLDRRKQRWP
jgi:hypothetical protein